MKKIVFTLAALTFILISCETKEKNTAYTSLEVPQAEKIPEELTMHGDTRVDDYFWMRLSDEQKNAETPDQQTQNVLNYLGDENSYREEALKHTKGLQENLFDEIVGRIKKDDQSVPYNNNGYSYYTRYEEGMDYALYCRKKLDGDGTEEILLNGPEMAKGYAYYGIGSRSVSETIAQNWSWIGSGRLEYQE